MSDSWLIAMGWRIDGGGGHELDLKGCASRRKSGCLWIVMFLVRFTFLVYTPRGMIAKRSIGHTLTLC